MKAKLFGAEGRGVCGWSGSKKGVLVDACK